MTGVYKCNFPMVWGKRRQRRISWPHLQWYPLFVVFGSVIFLLNLLSEQPLVALWDLEEKWTMQRWDGQRSVDIVTGKSVSYRNNYFSRQRGFTMCAGEVPPMFTSVLYNIKAMRTRWKTRLPITVAHCDELSEKSVKRLRDAHIKALQEMGDLDGIDSGLGQQGTGLPILDITNLCMGAPRSKKKRLRSWFCKAGALIASPYQETILMDTDVVWLQNPEKLFDAPLYKDTGSLFFRDRYIPAKPDSVDGRGRSLQMKSVREYISQRQGRHVGWEDKVVTRSLYKNGHHGINYFWANNFPEVPTKYGVGLAHMQESSVVILDAHRMPRTVEVLRDILPTFDLGYGDKEMFWLAATIANESFSFEPYLQGLYGDCGHVLHFDPTQVTASDIIASGLRQADGATRPRDVQPFFLNGQYVSEGVRYLGSMMAAQMTKPQLASSDQPIRFMMGELHATTHAPCGGCNNAGGCVKVPEGMNEIILDQQRFQLEHVGPPQRSYIRMIYNWFWKRVFVNFTPIFLLS